MIINPSGIDDTLNIRVSDEEARTIWFALQSYAKRLKVDLDEATGGTPVTGEWELEDTVFLSHTLWQATQLMWDMLHTNESARKALNIE